VLVCGAGVSTAVTGGAALGWKGLIENAIDAASGKPGDDWSVNCKASLATTQTGLWLSVADFIQEKMGGWAGESYRAWLKDSVGKLETKNPALLDAIKDLQCRVATTNYDELLRAHLGAMARTPGSIRGPSPRPCPKNVKVLFGIFMEYGTSPSRLSSRSLTTQGSAAARKLNFFSKA